MNPELRERRIDMIEAIGKRIRPSHFICTLAKKWKVKEETLQRDWARRRQWMPKLMQLGDPTLIPELLAGVIDLLPELRKIIDAKNTPPHIRLGAIHRAATITLDYIDQLQSLGYAYTEPTKIEGRLIQPIVVKMWTPEDAEKLREKKE